MPKVKLGYSNNYRALSENIKINMIKKGYNRKDIADKSIVKYSTLCYRIKCPETLTIKELCIIANTLNIAPWELLEGV